MYSSRGPKHYADLTLLVFPGGFLPTVSLLVESLTKGSSNSLIVDSISNIGPHYARTLREWRRRFEAKFEEVVVPALQFDYPEVMGPQTGEDGRREIEVFKRKWICKPFLRCVALADSRHCRFLFAFDRLLVCARSYALCLR
jgi:hypothetical protein